MKDIVIDALERIRGLFNLYTAMLGLLAIGFVVHWMNTEFGLKQEPLKIFSYVIHKEYFSLIYGLLFAVFVVLLYLRLRLLKDTFTVCKSGAAGPFDEIRMVVRHFHWVASPFQRGSVGPFFFWSLLAAGFALLGKVTFSHLLGSLEQGSQCAYVGIGIFDLFMLVGCLALVRLMSKNISSVKERFNETNQRLPNKGN